jgi:hypothetical protein
MDNSPADMWMAIAAGRRSYGAFAPDMTSRSSHASLPMVIQMKIATCCPSLMNGTTAGLAFHEQWRRRSPIAHGGACG